MSLLSGTELMEHERISGNTYLTLDEYTISNSRKIRKIPGRLQDHSDDRLEGAGRSYH